MESQQIQDKISRKLVNLCLEILKRNLSVTESSSSDPKLLPKVIMQKKVEPTAECFQTYRYTPFFDFYFHFFEF